MRSKSILLAVYFILATAAISKVYAEDRPSGFDVMEKQKKQHKAKTEKTQYDMILVDRKGRERNRVLHIYVREGEGALDKTLLKFTEPADIANVGLLTWEQGDDKDDDQWLYLPAKRQVKRIASSGKKNQFMGTDLAFEDLRPENLEANDYAIIGEEDFDGHACWVIEATPSTAKEKKDSGYSKRTFWIRKDIHFTLKTEYYDKRGNHIKTTTNEDVKAVDGDIWRSGKSTTETIKRHTKTIMSSTKRELNVAIEDSFFTQNNLKRDRLK